jgi:hypothetical protein
MTARVKALGVPTGSIASVYSSRRDASLEVQRCFAKLLADSRPLNLAASLLVRISRWEKTAVKPLTARWW